MKVWLFWIVWGLDAVIGAVFVVFFFLGLVDGSVSSFNIRLWIGILATLAGLLGGSLCLDRLGHPVLGMILLLGLAIPGLLYGIFILLTIVTKTSWN